MIDAKELRIGNHIYDAGYNVISLTAQRLADIDNGLVVSEPIYLDNSHLLDAGFEHRGTNEYGAVFTMGKLSITYGLVSTYTYSYFITGGKPTHVFNYVHQFENLVFAFTGKEINLNKHG